MPANRLLILIVNSPIAQSIDPDEKLRYFTWTGFTAVAVVYTAIVFWTELAKDGPFIFSRKNARSKLVVLQWHATFLIILLFGYRICSNVLPWLPFWMSNTFRLDYEFDRVSIVDLVVLLAVIGMAFLERKWLYKEKEESLGSSEESR